MSDIFANRARLSSVRMSNELFVLYDQQHNSMKLVNEAFRAYFEFLKQNFKLVDENNVHWCIDTKYYTANVHIQFTTEESCKENVKDNILVWMNAKNTWYAQLEKHVLDHCMAFVVYGEQETAWKKKVADFCIQHEIELIVILPDFPMHVEDGIARFLEMLQCHSWSNINRKDSKPKEIKDSNSKEMKDCKTKEMKDTIASTLAASEMQDEAFQEIFQQASLLREQGKALSDQERRERAARLAEKMLRMMGDDDD